MSLAGAYLVSYTALYRQVSVTTNEKITENSCGKPDVTQGNYRGELKKDVLCG
jgi:hypothetical protein